jgi:hypothetical protein
MEVPTAITTHRGESNPKTRLVKESPRSVTESVNAALANNQKFVLVTDYKTHEERSIAAADVREIKAV